MRTVKLDELLERARARKRELGLTETADQIESMRNKGGQRTPEKRELLRRVETRAKAAGGKPVTSHY